MHNQATFAADVVDGIGVITIFGEVDLSNVAELKHRLDQAAAARGQGIVVDLTKAAYFDSRTIALLADFARQSHVHRQRLALVAPSDGFAARILNIAGLPRIVPTLQSVSEAVASVKESA